MSYRNQDILMNIDSQSSRKVVNSVIIANGSYFGGGMHIAPGADPTDGEFDTVVIKGVGSLELLVNLLRIYRGAHVTHPKVFRQRARQIVVESAGLPVQADGELAGETPARFEMLPQKLSIII